MCGGRGGGRERGGGGARERRGKEAGSSFFFGHGGEREQESPKVIPSFCFFRLFSCHLPLAWLSSVLHLRRRCCFLFPPLLWPKRRKRGRAESRLGREQ